MSFGPASSGWACCGPVNNKLVDCGRARSLARQRPSPRAEAARNRTGARADRGARQTDARVCRSGASQRAECRLVEISFQLLRRRRRSSGARRAASRDSHRRRAPLAPTRIRLFAIWKRSAQVSRVGVAQSIGSRARRQRKSNLRAAPTRRRRRRRPIGLDVRSLARSLTCSAGRPTGAAPGCARASAEPSGQTSVGAGDARRGTHL